MDIKRFHALAEQFSQKHILVMGDLMLDSYMWGQANRISPEAPVPVVSVKEVTHSPGGAANVGWNIASLSAKVTMAGVVGNDIHGEQLLTLMSERGMNVESVTGDTNRPTTVKTRVIANSQQVVRTDFESLDELSNESLEAVQASVLKNIKDVDAIILADYNKGLFSEKMIGSILSIANENNVPVYVDPKHDHFYLFKGVRFFKPNANEFDQAMNSANIEDGSRALQKILDVEFVLVTLGASGMLLTTADESIRIPTKALAVHDVSGAGDTVISVFTLADLARATPEEAATMANLAAGRVCEEVGVVPIDLEMLTEMLNNHRT
jgi:rfaE bifunctional protein kinase chain/domain